LLSTGWFLERIRA